MKYIKRLLAEQAQKEAEATRKRKRLEKLGKVARVKKPKKTAEPREPLVPTNYIKVMHCTTCRGVDQICFGADICKKVEPDVEKCPVWQNGFATVVKPEDLIVTMRQGTCTCVRFRGDFRSGYRRTGTERLMMLDCPKAWGDFEV